MNMALSSAFSKICTRTFVISKHIHRLPKLPSCTRINAFCSSSEPHYDIAIVGGGIVGSALACQIASNPLFSSKTIALIDTGLIKEESPPREVEDFPDLRVYTITPSSQQILEAGNVWQKIDRNAYVSFREMQVWDAMGNGHVRFHARKSGRKELAHVIENSVLMKALQNRLVELQTSDAIKLYSPAKVKHYRRSTAASYYSHLGLESGEQIRASLIVAADGGKSVIRTLSNLGTWGWDYDQVAVIATVKTNEPNTVAWQRFFPTGPVALLPMRNGYSSVVWSCSMEMAEELKRMTPKEFSQRLNEALLSPANGSSEIEFPLFSDLIKGMDATAQTFIAAGAMADPFQAPPKTVETISPRVSFPLKMSHAISYVRPGVALVGDSAHSVHPLAGQGLNLGLADVKALVQVLEEGIMHGESLSSPTVLQEYEDKRKQANLKMALAMDGFKRLFGPSPDAVRVARNVGMSALNAIEPLKNKIVKYAMGIE